MYFGLTRKQNETTSNVSSGKAHIENTCAVVQGMTPINSVDILNLLAEHVKCSPTLCKIAIGLATNLFLS